SLDWDEAAGSPFQKKYTIKVRNEIPIVLWADEDEVALKPSVYEVLELIKEEEAICAYGLVSAKEIMALFKAAKAMGIERLLVTHPEFISGVSLDQAKE